MKKAAANAVAQRFLLQRDADALIKAAEASAVLRPASVAQAPESERRP